MCDIEGTDTFVHNARKGRWVNHEIEYITLVDFAFRQGSDILDMKLLFII